MCVIHTQDKTWTECEGQVPGRWPREPGHWWPWEQPRLVPEGALGCQWHHRNNASVPFLFLLIVT